ncbi:hypothetical protein [Povalibacter sp.]|uniref:hypothetical protein n=1 Tax=Povalibacter sp. TaxID=1962978 RepID=UPI002F401507
MQRSLVAALCALLFLSACGSSDGDNDADPVTNPGNGAGVGDDPGTDPGETPGEEPGDAPDDYTPLPTDTGTPVAAAVSAVIGAAGGQLSTADGTLTVDVPAGAFDADRTLAIQEITNEAHGAKGRAFRITPEGLHTTIPMTVRWRYTDADALGSDPRALTIAFQDAARIWHTYREPAHDAAARTLSVPTTHFSDWSLVAGVQLLPHAATLNVGQSVTFQTVVCDEHEEKESPYGDLAVPTVSLECFTTPAASILTSEWSVNGAPGGSARHGIIVGNGDPMARNATYTAPATKPAPNVVAVSARHKQLANEDLLLVANVTILDEAATCDRLREVQKFDAEVSFDSFRFNASAEDRTHAGNHQGRLKGRLTKIETGPTFGVWTSYLEPLQGGFVRINDAFSYTPPSGDGYSGTFDGSGAPLAPSLITLKIDYATCTFDLHSAFAVDATTIKNGDMLSGTLGIGSLYLHDQPVPLEQLVSGTLEGERDVVAGNDIDVTNYVPVHDVHADWSLTGTTIARWMITPAQ